jgi:hypothetical protein
MSDIMILMLSIFFVFDIEETVTDKEDNCGGLYE